MLEENPETRCQCAVAKCFTAVRGVRDTVIFPPKSVRGVLDTLILRSLRIWIPDTLIFTNSGYGYFNFHQIMGPDTLIFPQSEHRIL